MDTSATSSTARATSTAGPTPTSTNVGTGPSRSATASAAPAGADSTSGPAPRGTSEQPGATSTASRSSASTGPRGRWRASRRARAPGRHRARRSRADHRRGRPDGHHPSGRARAKWRRPRTCPSHPSVTRMRAARSPAFSRGRGAGKQAGRAAASARPRCQTGGERPTCDRDGGGVLRPRQDDHRQELGARVRTPALPRRSPEPRRHRARAYAQVVFMLVGADEAKMEKLRECDAAAHQGLETRSTSPRSCARPSKSVVTPIIFGEALELIRRAPGQGPPRRHRVVGAEEVVRPLGDYLGVDDRDRDAPGGRRPRPLHRRSRVLRVRRSESRRRSASSPRPKGSTSRRRTRTATPSPTSPCSKRSATPSPSTPTVICCASP